MNEGCRQPVIGIVGAGQLARMTIQAAIPLALPIRLLAERIDDGAALVSPNVTIGSPSNRAALSAFAARCDVVTFDHELVPREQLDLLAASGIRVFPSPATMALAQDKRLQRERFSAAGLPVPPFSPIANADELREFGRKQGWPLILKAARGGYDGRGVWIADDDRRGPQLAGELLANGVELLAEQLVSIEREVAILVARRPAGETAVYPLVETVQVGGMCREILAPAAVGPEIAAIAHDVAETIANVTGVVGILAVELFVAGGRVLINEIATRPHNSGHYSIEGCVTSQFEQHLRGIVDWPLGSTELTGLAVATVNVVGAPDGADPTRHLQDALAIAGAHVHLYGKVAKPGRKLGHVTVVGETIETARRAANRAATILMGGAA
jgi:5-(carboxyamino)imidazole ribonucleotide synthase